MMMMNIMFIENIITITTNAMMILILNSYNIHILT
jgi:hypothetical protein